MKTNTIQWITVCAALALAAKTQAQDQPAPGGYVTTSRVYFWPGYAGQPPQQPGDIYFNAELGGNLQQDLSIRSAGTKVSFDPGERGDISVGVDVTEALAFELQTGVLWNNINTSGSQAMSLQGHDADLNQVPLLANVIFRAPLPGGLTPYVGAGFGLVASTLDIHHYDHWDSDTDYTAGYQALAGLNCAINRHMEVGVGYRFLGTPAHTWFEDDPNLYVSAGQTFSHSIMATFTFSF